MAQLRLHDDPQGRRVHAAREGHFLYRVTRTGSHVTMRVMSPETDTMRSFPESDDLDLTRKGCQVIQGHVTGSVRAWISSRDLDAA